MPATSRRRLRIGLVIAATTVLGLVTGPVVAATAESHPPALLQDQARTARPVAIAAAAGVTADRTRTHLKGWSRSARSVRAQHRFSVTVRVSGGERVVRLERRVAGEWRLLDRERTSASGRATLTWVPRTAKQHVVLRVRVPATATHRAERSEPRRIRVVQPAVATPRPAASASAAPTTSPSATPSPVATTSADEALRARLLVLVNEARGTARTCGSTRFPAVPALARSTALDGAAGDYAAEMATRDFFSHTSPDGSTMSSRLQAVGVRNTTMRENIAAGQETAESVMTGWLESSGHCANLMAADVTRIGLGHAISTTARYSHYWVQDFAG